MESERKTSKSDGLAAEISSIFPQQKHFLVNNQRENLKNFNKGKILMVKFYESLSSNKRFYVKRNLLSLQPPNFMHNYFLTMTHYITRNKYGHASSFQRILHKKRSNVPRRWRMRGQSTNKQAANKCRFELLLFLSATGNQFVNPNYFDLIMQFICINLMNCL
jgi:hypothetical protein